MQRNNNRDSSSKSELIAKPATKSQIKLILEKKRKIDQVRRQTRICHTFIPSSFAYIYYAIVRNDNYQHHYLHGILQTFSLLDEQHQLNLHGHYALQIGYALVAKPGLNHLSLKFWDRITHLKNHVIDRDLSTLSYDDAQGILKQPAIQTCNLIILEWLFLGFFLFLFNYAMLNVEEDEYNLQHKDIFILDIDVLLSACYYTYNALTAEKRIIGIENQQLTRKLERKLPFIEATFQGLLQDKITFDLCANLKYSAYCIKLNVNSKRPERVTQKIFSYALSKNNIPYTMVDANVYEIPGDIYIGQGSNALANKLNKNLTCYFDACDQLPQFKKQIQQVCDEIGLSIKFIEGSNPSKLYAEIWTTSDTTLTTAGQYLQDLYPDSTINLDANTLYFKGLTACHETKLEKLKQTIQSMRVTPSPTVAISTTSTSEPVSVTVMKKPKVKTRGVPRRQNRQQAVATKKLDIHHDLPEQYKNLPISLQPISGKHVHDKQSYAILGITKKEFKSMGYNSHVFNVFKNICEKGKSAPARRKSGIIMETPNQSSKLKALGLFGDFRIEATDKIEKPDGRKYIIYGKITQH